MYFAEYFFFFAELLPGDSHKRFAIVMIVSTQQTSFIKYGGNTWVKAANHNLSKAASPDMFVLTR